MAIRLIDTSTLQMTFVAESRPYAILSHTWENDSEISFQEMVAISEDPQHPATKKSGYQKILKTCETAKNNGIPYVWVDTCCIDKTSSSELSEAINAMYRWYQEARVCYVFLSDFNIWHDTESSLAQCRWFTRGWCLQELIAPKVLLFFDAGWHEIGSKADLTSLISEITSIDREVLIDSSLIKYVPVARRMSWAAKRMTTREEDMAYCLLGIFDVNMPMLYGEGSKAFLRLQEEIIKDSNDLSIFALHQSPAKVSDVDCFNDQPLYDYRSLFATLPSDFKECGQLVHTRNDVHWNNAFSLTNKGLYFRRAEMQVEVGRGLYSLPLNCKPSGSKPSWMHLRKVGPGLYAKLDVGLESHVDEGSYTEVENDVYIIREITPQVQRQLEQAEEYAIRVQSRSHDLLKALQVMQRSTSSDRWDVSRQLFLTRGEKSFGGFWKVFPSFARKIQGSAELPQLPSAHFYLVCGLNHSSAHSGPRAWVRLLSFKEWTDLGNKYGILTNPANVEILSTENTAAQLVFGPGPNSLLVTATIQLTRSEGRPIFVLELDMKENKER
ncbi:hypothetical protein F4809DRAFT_434118 [Biscogniauxia mediterranea]|nr:hypothetical protein F4809DRAFT_434118 [Biscogniauxia mediterranea]